MALRPSSDLGALMQSAMEEYNEATKDLKKDYDQTMEARSISDVQAYVTEHADKFKMFRHDGSKLDKFRTAVGDNLSQIQIMSDVLAGPTTSAFPAAAPIFTAINFLVFTGNRVRSDFDDLMGFLQEVGACMNSISIVEGFVHSGRQIPQLDTEFKKVFSAVLQLCGISTKYISDGRFKRGLMRGVLGNDRGLGRAYSQLQRAMVDLGRSIQNGTFAGVVVLTNSMVALEDQVAELDRLARETNQATRDVKDIVKESRDDIKDIRDVVKDQNLPDTRRIRIFFEGFATWEAPFEERKKKFVDGTADWLLKYDAVYQKWFAEGVKKSWGRGLLSILWIWGGTGTGKSVLAYKVVDELKSFAAEEGRGVSVIYYFFRLERTVTLKSALKSLIIQIADYDELYRQRIATLIKTSGQSKADDVDTMAIWKTYIANQYVSGSARGMLHVVLDGIEELTSGDRKVLQDIVGQIISDQLRIKILLFGQSQINDTFGKVENVQVPHIEITPARIDGAIKTFIANRVSNFQISLDDSLKNEIIDTLSINVGGFAFVDACLDEIEGTQQVEDIPDVLTGLPNTYKDLLKRVLGRILGDINSKKNQGDRLNAIKILLYWTAMAYRYLSVKELKCVLAMKTKYSNFNVVGEISKTCSGLLWIPSEDGTEDAIMENKAEDHDAEGSADRKPAHASNEETLLDSHVKFREFRFEDCFRDVEWSTGIENELVEDATVVRFEIAMTTMRVLTCRKTDPLYGKTRNLEELSASYWLEHLAAVNFEDATDDQISQLTRGIMDIFKSPETLSVVLENQNIIIYDNFASAMPIEKRDPNDGGIIIEWLLKVQNLGQERVKFTKGEFAWVEKVISKPATLLESLIKEHVTHWFQAQDISKGTVAFELALSALQATDEIPRPESRRSQPGVAEVIQVSQKCPDYPMDENAYRAIGTTLRDNEEHVSAEEYYQKAEDCSTTPTGMFYTLVELGTSYYDNSKYDLAQEVLTRALLLEEEVKSQTQLPGYVDGLLRRTYFTLGNSVRLSMPNPPPNESIERAIHALECAITFPDVDQLSSDLWILDKILTVHVESNDFKSLVNRVISWDKGLCSAWMLEDIEYGRGHLTDFNEAAKNEHRILDMIACYEAAMGATSEKGSELLIRVEFASMYWKVLEDEDLSHVELSKIMESTDLSPRGKVARQTASFLLSEMMYGRIKLAPTVWMKRILATELSCIADKDTESGVDILSIRPNISLASAYLASNEPQKAATLLNPAVSMCIEWLRDDVSWNDSRSLRLFAKLLACAGFHRDASIAYSAHFSILESEAVIEAGSDNERAADSVGNPQPEIQGGNGKATEKRTAEYEEVTTTDAEEKDAKTSTTSIDNDTENAAIEKRSNNLSRLIPPAEEDLDPATDSFLCNCNGCSKEFSYWLKAEPLYLCLVCQDTDLCKDCHAKRMQANEQSGSNTNVKYCGMNHDYVSGPIEGWGGIKDSIMTILPEKVEFKHWLKDVEEKWTEWHASFNSEKVDEKRTAEIAKAIKRLEIHS